MKKWMAALITAALLLASACGNVTVNVKQDENGYEISVGTQEAKETKADTEAEAPEEAEEAEEEITILGEGETTFDFVVVDADGKEEAFVVKTDAENLADALTEVEMIEGDETEYGLYVKVVNGITADYDTDGAYWALLIDGEYAMTGASSTPVEEGKTYSFVYTKD